MESEARPALKRVYIGAKSIVCPLGDTPSEVYRAMLGGKSGLRHFDRPFGLDMSCHMGRVSSTLLQEENVNSTKLENMLAQCYNNSLRKLAYDPFSDDSGLVIICTTKGNIDLIKDPKDERLPLHRLSSFLQYQFYLSKMPLVVSNACISGVVGIITAARLIRSGVVDHVMVLGGDLVSEFTLAGFASLKALEDGPCRPYDARRTGINLGEAAAGLVLSADRDLFKGSTAEYIAGASSNDANHISGPSRTGEGLYRSIIKTLNMADVSASQVAHINTHGTGTIFNDEMESIALERAGLSDVPVNSLKGYIGHTLGAAGVIETLLGLEAMKQEQLIPSFGYEQHGVSRPMNIIRQPETVKGNYFLKTASGFGGGNASALFKMGVEK
jgi:3-oxoacyl-[acyl-carrier-protein] synthase-1